MYSGLIALEWANNDVDAIALAMIIVIIFDFMILVCN